MQMNKLLRLGFFALFVPLFYLNLLFYQGFFDVKPDTRLFTEHHCLGGTDMELWRIKDGKPDQTPPTVNLKAMRCEFRNLHLMENKRFLYLYSSEKPPSWLRTFFHVRGLHLEFVQNTLSTSLVRRPLAVVFSTCRPKGYPNGANTPGHDFDYIFNAYQSMIDFGLGTDAQIYLHPVSSRYCPELQSKFWATLGELQTDMFNLRERMVFTKVVVAQQKLVEEPMKPPPTSILRQYVAHALDVLQIRDVNDPMLCGIQNKQFRHRFLNPNAIQVYLRRGCKDVINMQTYQIKSAKDEIQAVRSLDVYVTPGGGVSVSALFLSPKATLVVGKICWPTDKRNGNLHHITEKGIDFSCHRSDNLLWDSVNWFRIKYVGPRRVSDLALEAAFQQTGPWKNTQNAFSYSYNVSIELLDDRLRFAKRRPHTMVNVAGYMKTGTGMVAKALALDYEDASLVHAPNVPQSEGNYLLRSQPSLNLFLTCENDLEDLLPSVRKFACKAPDTCREEVRQNFLNDIYPYIDFTKHHIIQKTPTISLAEMEACFAPNVVHYFTLRHPMYWSQQYYWKDFVAERGNWTQPLYATFKTIQTLRMFLQLKPVRMSKLYFVRYEQEITRRRLEIEQEGTVSKELMYPKKQTDEWIKCTKNTHCNRCLVHAQQALGLFGYNMLDPWHPLKKDAKVKMQGFKYGTYLSTIHDAEKKFKHYC